MEKTGYYRSLKIPYFVGVVEDSTKLHVYSGESLCHFFAFFGNPVGKSDCKKVFIKLVEKRDNENFGEPINGNYYIYFPYVVSLEIDYNYEQAPKKLSDFFDPMSMIQRNLSHMGAGMFIFELFGDNTKRKIYFGPGSAQIFRKNLIDRLEEAIHNIRWLKENNPENIINSEEETIHDFYDRLKKLYEEKKS